MANVGGTSSYSKKKRTVGTLVSNPIQPSGASGDSRNIGGGSSGAYYTQAATPKSSGTPTGAGTNRAQTPFGRYIAPSALHDLWNDPQAAVTDYFKFMDLPRTGGGYASALDDADRVQLLYLLLNNNNPNFLSFGDAGPIDWLGRYEANQFKPGAAGVGPSDIINALFNAKAGTTVYQALNGGSVPMTAEQQTKAWLDSLQGGFANTMPDAVYQTLIARYQQAARDFNAQRAHNPGGATSFGDYLRQQGLGPQAFGV